jgi:hypothetical protein
VSNQTDQFKEAHLRVSCPACGAMRGSHCRSVAGVKLAGTHRVRVAKQKETAK